MYQFPMSNAAIAEQLDILSKLMDIFGENSFKTKTYANAAYTIKKLPQNICDLSPEELQALKVVGDSVKAKISELLTTGTIAALDVLRIQTPPGVLEMMQIKGLGPKKIAILWKELDITSIGELEYACQENRLMTFKGFGQKTQDDIMAKIQFLRNSEGLFLWKQSDDEWAKWQSAIAGTFADHALLPAGLYARQLPVTDGITLLTSAPVADIHTWLAANGFQQITATDNILTATGPGGISWQWHHCDVAVFGLSAIRLRSSEAFMTALQQMPLPAEAATEEAVFETLQLPYIPPYLREAADITAIAQQVQDNNIITTASIKGIIHSHSTWSDGMHSLEEMAVAARAMGMEYLVISDHSKSAFYANGLSVERIRAQHREIDRLNTELAPFRIFKSIEADILNDGSLDYEDEVLALFDLVIASVHSNLNMTEEKAMQRLLTAVANPYTTILGHPTGRLLLSRQGYPVDHAALTAACIAQDVVIEINAHPRRLDLDWTWIAAAQSKGAMLSVNPDAHATEHLQLIQYGVSAAQKGGLLATRNLSSMSLEAFESFLSDRKTKKGL